MSYQFIHCYREQATNEAVVPRHTTARWLWGRLPRQVQPGHSSNWRAVCSSCEHFIVVKWALYCCAVSTLLLRCEHFIVALLALCWCVVSSLWPVLWNTHQFFLLTFPQCARRHERGCSCRNHLPWIFPDQYMSNYPEDVELPPNSSPPTNFRDIAWSRSVRKYESHLRETISKHNPLFIVWTTVQCNQP